MKKFFIKSIFFSSLIFCAQIIVASPPVIPNELKLLDYYFKHPGRKNIPDIVYFGDSTINWSAQNDTSQQSMAGLLQLRLPNVHVTKITYPSYQSDVYLAYSEYIARKKDHPRFVIIPINLRSFSPEWNLKPHWQFEDEKFAARHKDTVWMKFYQPLAIFKFFESIIRQVQSI